MWNQLLIVLLGLWLMAAPDVMGYEGPERTNDHVIGPLVVSMAMIAMSETTRAMRWINVLLGAWLVMAPVLLHYESLHIGVRSGVVGLAVLGLSFIEGTIKERLGGGWTRLWTDSSLPSAVETETKRIRRLRRQ